MRRRPLGGGGTVNEDVARLQEIFLGRTVPAHPAVVTDRRDSAGGYQGFDPPIPATVSLDTDGALVVCARPVSMQVDDLETWDGARAFIHAHVCFFPASTTPLGRYTDAHTDIDDPNRLELLDPHRTGVWLALEPDTITAIQAQAEALGLQIASVTSDDDPDDAEWADHDDDEPEDEDEDEEDLVGGWEEEPVDEDDAAWRELRADITTILERSDYLSEGAILDTLGTDYQWEGLHIDQVLDVLLDEDFPSGLIAHLWLWNPERDWDPTDASDLELAVTSILQDAPTTADLIFEELTATGDFDGLDLETVYDVLYHPGIPTYKITRAWCLIDDDGE